MSVILPGNIQQRPIPVLPDYDPLVLGTEAYCGRLRKQADEYRRLAEKYDALADNSQPIKLAGI